METLNKIKIKTQTETLYTLKVPTNDADILAQKISTLSCNNESKFEYVPSKLYARQVMIGWQVKMPSYLSKHTYKPL